MTAGQTYSVSVTMYNAGTTTWTAAGNYKLGSQNAQGNQWWGFNRVLLPSGVSVAPGSQYTFNFSVTAPTTTGSYPFQWKMVQDGVTWFGDQTTNVNVNVTSPSNATFVSQSIPATMTAGHPYNVSVTMQNTGTTTWTAAAKFRLGTQNPTDNTTWGFNRVLLPNNTSIAPGSSATFSFKVTAPSTSGTYNMQYMMLQEGVNWFGNRTSNIAVTVQ
jgi:hypothetical protein